MWILLPPPSPPSFSLAFSILYTPWMSQQYKNEIKSSFVSAELWIKSVYICLGLYKGNKIFPWLDEPNYMTCCINALSVTQLHIFMICLIYRHCKFGMDANKNFALDPTQILYPCLHIRVKVSSKGRSLICFLRLLLVRRIMKLDFSFNMRGYRGWALRLRPTPS